VGFGGWQSSGETFQLLQGTAHLSVHSVFTHLSHDSTLATPHEFMSYSRQLLQLFGSGPGNIWNGAVVTNGNPGCVVVTHHKQSL
jgi:hypothetical protein